MTTIINIPGNENIKDSRENINTNFENLNNDKLEASDIAGKQDILAEGPFVDGDKTKLDSIESGAEVNQTDSEIKTQYEANADTNAYTDSEKAEVATISNKSDIINISKVNSDVTLAVKNTHYLVNASAGDITITLPDVTAGETNVFQVTLSKDTHSCIITTTGGTQLIGDMNIVKNQTVGGSIFLVGNGVDGYDITGDSREYYRVIDLVGAGTTDFSVSGYESIGLYNCIGMTAGETRTIIIPDDPSGVVGFAFKALLDGEGTVLIKTLSGLPIAGQNEIAITNDSGVVEISSLGSNYAIIQDSRPKAQNVALQFYSLGEDSIVTDPGVPAFYKQTANSIDDARFNQITPTITSTVVTTTNQYGGGLIGDQGVIGGLLPEGPVKSILIAERSAGSGTATFYIEYYKWELGGTETLLGTSTTSSEINSASPTEYSITTTLPETIFGPTDRFLRKVYYNRTGGGSNPTIQFYAEGSNPSYSEIAIGASSITHNSLGGLQGGANGEYYHLSSLFYTALTSGTLDASALHNHNAQYLNKTNTTVFTPAADYQPATKKYVDDNATPTAIISTANTPTGADRIIEAVSLTTAEHTAATKVPTTLYLITDA